MRVCQRCGKEFFMKPYDRPFRFKLRKYCSFECSRPSFAGPRTKTCETCGKEFGMNSHDARSPSRFSIRKYCSRECYSKAPKSWYRRKPIDMPNRYSEEEMDL